MILECGYDIEVFKYDFLAVFVDKATGEIHRFHKKVSANMDMVDIKELLDKIGFLIGFNNHHYDDTMIAGMIDGMNPYILNNRIIVKREKMRLGLKRPVTIDVMQELPMGTSLKEIECNLGFNVHETPVDFNIDRPLTEEEIEQTFQYCENDVLKTLEVYDIRKDYFEGKTTLVKEFGLPINMVSKTRATIVASILEGNRQKEIPDDRLLLNFVDTLDWNYIPVEVQNFYNMAIERFKRGEKAEDIEKSSLKTTLCDVEHIYAWGGLHGARKKYIARGNLVHVDYESYYPGLMIEYGFISRRSADPKKFRLIRDQRLKWKKEGNPLQAVYKIVINAKFGVLKAKFNALFDPKMSNNVCVNGQLLITELAQRIMEQGGMELVQSNTDGLIFRYDDELAYSKMLKVVDEFSSRIRIPIDIDNIESIAQRDVNNYIIQFEPDKNGYQKIEAKGVFGKWKKVPYDKGSLTIVARALKQYYVDGKSIEETILECYDNDDLMPFQLVAKMGGTYDKMVHEQDGEMVEVQKVNRVFASSNDNNGKLYKVKVNQETGVESFTQIANCPDHTVVHNYEMDSFDKTQLDLGYYVDLCQKALFGTRVE